MVVSVVWLASSRRAAHARSSRKQARVRHRCGRLCLVVGVAQRGAAAVVARFVVAIPDPRPVALGPQVLSGGPVAARAVFQAAARAIWCLWSFSRLWVAVINRHSERAADLPRR
jgi:hypothetical protein